MESTYHQPVLADEVIEGLNVLPGGNYIDCTTGQGGHTEAILLKCEPSGKVLALDLDPSAINSTHSRLTSYMDNLTLFQINYTELDSVHKKSVLPHIDGILFDLGLSSFQLDSSDRGFSFQRDEPLDMRFDPTGNVTAYDIINTYPEDNLELILLSYGEETRAKTIARRIVQSRPITTARMLASLVERAYRSSRGRIHPATKTFQAIRMAVNNELENISIGLTKAISVLRPGGRLVVISYHSLEDRIVKQFFKTESRDCICQIETLICSCNHLAKLKLVNKRIITPSHTEKSINPRSRSARMRVAEVI
ncbi:16S rRNA (cytosine(1402)-N(4))-methyltransferase RsmH [SAR202 cluster bacterium AC-409-J13_OGT_754m]|nr:16S rRNA (cytosine(1402)-N(4))-methyltransferase RsmH [SAR202 cluster bacterium AC-409-J13_OGT_754m]